MGKDLKDSESRTELVEIEKAYVKGMQEAIDTMEPIRSTKAFMTNAAGATAPLRESFDKCSTGLQQKRENFNTFAQLIRNQFDHGGAKYASGIAGKEFTDLICEAFPGESGVDWVLGTCMKYMGRYRNFGREKDLLKVATYMYLLWLKGGFHLKKEHDEDTKRAG